MTDIILYDLHCSVRRNSAMLVQGDLSSDVSKTAQRIVTEAVAIWGRLDVLVNNASLFYPTHLGAVTEEQWANLIQANLTAPFFLAQVYSEKRRGREIVAV